MILRQRFLTPNHSRDCCSAFSASIGLILRLLFNRKFNRATVSNFSIKNGELIDQVCERLDRHGRRYNDFLSNYPSFSYPPKSSSRCHVVYGLLFLDLFTGLNQILRLHRLQCYNMCLCISALQSWLYLCGQKFGWYVMSSFLYTIL